MSRTRPMWLVVNAASGGNNAAAVETLEHSCGEAGFYVARRIRFPDEQLPRIADLDRAGIDLLGIFAGDGTTNTAVTSLYGWGGSILVLPGGTMNLLYQRLHGDTEMERVVGAVAAGEARRLRPTVIRSPHGDTLAGLVLGPGTAWYEVREAMRQADLVAIADSTARAVGESVTAPRIACIEPGLGRPEGYALILLAPGESGMAVSGYYSETAEDYFAQTIALLRRKFREGPHDDLGHTQYLRVGSVVGEEFGLSLDGELKQGGPVEMFELARCEVDLLATHDDC